MSGWAGFADTALKWAMSERQAKLGRDAYKHRIRWTVEDAKAAGINPLFLIPGMSGQSAHVGQFQTLQPFQAAASAKQAKLAGEQAKAVEAMADKHRADAEKARAEAKAIEEQEILRREQARRAEAVGEIASDATSAWKTTKGAIRHGGWADFLVNALQIIDPERLGEKWEHSAAKPTRYDHPKTPAHLVPLPTTGKSAHSISRETSRLRPRLDYQLQRGKKSRVLSIPVTLPDGVKVHVPLVRSSNKPKSGKRSDAHVKAYKRHRGDMSWRRQQSDRIRKETNR